LTTSRMIHPYRNKQLFLDDHAIGRSYGLRRVLNKPTRTGPVLRPDRSRGQTSLQTADPPQWNSDKGVWEWFYGGGYAVAPQGRRLHAEQHATHYATSEDGVHWDTSPLGLHEWRGSKDNNIAIDPGGRSLTQILRDERDDDPARRYKALFTVGGIARYPAVSPDGFDWTMIDVPPIPSEDTSYLTYDEYTEQFLATVKIGTDWGRSVWLATSPDFLRWTDPTLILHSDEIDRNNRRRRIRALVDDPGLLTPPIVDETNHIAQIYKMPIMPYEGIYVGFPVVFNPAGAIPEPWGNFTAINQVELAVSRDLYDWQRVANRDVFIGVQPWDGVSYETMQMLTCGRPHVHEDREIWVYYSALRFRGPKELWAQPYQEYFDDIGALHLAKVRLDGFVSLDADRSGILETRPFALEGGSLMVNADASDGRISAEVVDALTGDALPGLTEDDCEPVRGDRLRGRLSWSAASELSHDRPVHVRFTLENARLYAFWLEK
jgi:hypothetical protein